MTKPVFVSPIDRSPPAATMSLRDHFAAMAMAQMCAGPAARMVASRDTRYDETNWAFIVASNAYDFADAMLVARDKSQAGATPDQPSAEVR